AAAAPGDVERAGRGLIDDVDVVTVDQDRLEAVGARAIGGRVLDGRDLVDRRVFHVAVVLADEYDRQLPYDREVQRLVKRADIRRAVAEQADRDLVRAAALRGPRRACRDRQVCADDRVRAHHVVLDARQ